MIIKYLVRPIWQGSLKPNRIVLSNDSCFTIDGKEYWIPKLYEVDGASIPKILWYIAGTPFEPDNVEPGIAHDPLYLTHKLPRSLADEVLFQLKYNHEIMIKTKPWLARYRSYKMWSGVRIGGAFAWNNSKEDKAELQRVRNILINRPDVDKFVSLWF